LIQSAPGLLTTSFLRLAFAPQSERPRRCNTIRTNSLIIGRSPLCTGLVVETAASRLDIPPSACCISSPPSPHRIHTRPGVALGSQRNSSFFFCTPHSLHHSTHHVEEVPSLESQSRSCHREPSPGGDDHGREDLVWLQERSRRTARSKYTAESSRYQYSIPEQTEHG
jgi:hypothetical protein